MPPRARPGWTLVAAIVVAAAAPGAAWGQARRGVVARAVATVPVSDGELAAAAAAAVSAGGAVAVLDPVGLASARRAAGAVEREKLERFGRARDLAREGWRAYLAVEPTFAEARLVEARRTLEAVLDLAGALDLVADVSLRLGAVRLHAGRAADAAAAFGLAAALDPEREPSPQEFAPEVIAEYERARASRAGRTGSLRVQAPEGATVEVDGAPAGRVGQGALVVAVAVGEHSLVVRAAGRLPAGLIVAVPAGGAEVEVPLDDDLVARALAGGDAAFALGLESGAAAGLLTAVATYAELDELLLRGAPWRDGQVALLGQRCGAAPVACGAVREVRFPVRGRPTARQLAAATEELVRELPEPAGPRALPPVLLEDTRLTEPEPPPDAQGRPVRPPPPPTRPWWRSPWVWVGVGTAAAVVAGAVILLSDDGAAGVEVVVPACEFWPTPCN